VSESGPPSNKSRLEEKQGEFHISLIVDTHMHAIKHTSRRISASILWSMAVASNCIDRLLVVLDVCSDCDDDRLKASTAKWDSREATAARARATVLMIMVCVVLVLYIMTIVSSCERKE
jgi:hypothetical protein